MKRILLCDDNEIENVNVKRLLERKFEGIDVVCFAGAPDAVEFLRANRVDLVVTDVRMPLMSGLELAGAMKQISRDIPVVIISAFGEFEYAQRAVELGVVNYLTKPLDIVKFENVVREILFSGESDASLSDISVDILGECGVDSAEFPSFSSHTRRAVQYIQDHFPNCDFGLASLCQNLFISPSQLCAVFKKDVNSTVLKFIITYRMKSAKYLIENTQLPLKNVMAQVGISSLSYFCSSFKKYFSINPSDFRRNE